MKNVKKGDIVLINDRKAKVTEVCISDRDGEIWKITCEWIR